jgi:uncharacterized membrane protein
MKEKKKYPIITKIIRPLLTGIFAIFPLAITIVVITWLINFIISFLGPESNFGSILQSIGLNFVKNQTIAYLIGVGATIVLIYFLGMLVQAGLRNQWNAITDGVMNRIPFIKTIYDASKKITGLFDTKDQPDIKSMSPVMCYFGGEGGTAVLALLTSQEIITINGTDYYSVMIPTSPIPIGGAIIFVPTGWVKKVNFGLEGLVNVYVSMGVTAPEYLHKEVVE